MRRSYLGWLIPILVVIAGAIWIDLPNNPGIHVGPVNRDIRIVRGLDLQGGLQVLLEADLPADTTVTSDQMTAARDIVENRVNALGVVEPLVQVAGARRIVVELPGVSDVDQAIGTIKQTGLLEFIDMSNLSPSDALSLEGQTVQTDFGGSGVSLTPTGTATAGTGTPEVGTSTPTAQSAMATPIPTTPTTTPTVAPGASPTPVGPAFHTVMTGAALKSASASINSNTGQYQVSFTLTPEGQKLFADYTTAHIGDVLGIVLDKTLISAPRVDSAITTGSGVITGSFTYQSANQLAVQLRYGSLPIPLKVIESRTVGPTLGQDSLRKSTMAGVIGLIVVVLFMAIYYRLPGFLADLALLVYASVTFALFKFIPVTLTLPGVAGFVLSVGVAVDANVLIFERMKEELRSGRTVYQAIDMGFSRAWPSIRDSNISTLITCLILYWFGNTFGASIVKGFSLTLALGVLVSLFTAITVTRTFLHVVLDGIGFSQHPRWYGV
jgi:preprotein translocase subunit SecD